jgi:hypothetical protein
MKNKFFLALPILFVGFVACNKKDPANDPNNKSESFTYKGLDGTPAKATFETNKSGKTLTIEANTKKFQLDLADETTYGKIYQRNGVKAVVKGDSINLVQGENVVPLVKDK